MGNYKSSYVYLILEMTMGEDFADVVYASAVELRENPNRPTPELTQFLAKTLIKMKEAMKSTTPKIKIPTDGFDTKIINDARKDGRFVTVNNNKH